VDEVERALRQQHIDALNRHVARDRELKDFELSLVGSAASGQALPRVIFTETLIDKWQELRLERDAALDRRREAERRYLEHVQRTRGRAR
jgi:hypothetical protein